jgi:hypothetical protein
MLVASRLGLAPPLGLASVGLAPPLGLASVGLAPPLGLASVASLAPLVTKRHCFYNARLCGRALFFAGAQSIYCKSLETFDTPLEP